MAKPLPWLRGLLSMLGKQSNPNPTRAIPTLLIE